MIMGIICLILFIFGIILMGYGNDDGNILMIAVGMVIIAVGVLGTIAFIGINMETISDWFRI